MCVTSLASHRELEYGNALDSGAPLPGVRSFATLTHTMQLQSFVLMRATNMQQLVIVVLSSIDGYAYTAGSRLLSYSIDFYVYSIQFVGNDATKSIQFQDAIYRTSSFTYCTWLPTPCAGASMPLCLRCLGSVFLVKPDTT